MAKASKKRKKKDPDLSSYPVAPHIIGMDWIELPVRSPQRSAEQYLSIGFSPRGTTSRNRAVAIGGTVIVFKRQPQSSTNTQSTGFFIQLPVDNIELKRQQLAALGLKPGAVRRQSRGDHAFQWRDEDGHTVRFVGPARRETDKTLID